jgi:hypothetical protein
MNITDHCNAIHKQANQMRNAVWSLVFGAVAAYLVWTFGGASWWVYALLFTPSVFGLAQALTDDPATQNVLDLGELPDSGFDNGALAWKGSRLPQD